MSGYLQRLVQTAAQPVQTVHPFTGSIYASRSDNESRGFESEESVTAAPSPSALAAATSQHQSVSAPAPRRSDRTPTPKYQPIALVSPSTPLSSEDKIDDMASSQEQLVQAPHLANLQANTEQPPARVLDQTEFHPLLPQEAVTAERQLTAASFRAETRAAHDTRHPNVVESANDDIQIHIGRIEVTAVHPPAPRTAKTPDRSLSLDAYLNRRAR
jgi:hypothetical protein